MYNPLQVDTSPFTRSGPKIHGMTGFCDIVEEFLWQKSYAWSEYSALWKKEKVLWVMLVRKQRKLTVKLGLNHLIWITFWTTTQILSIGVSFSKSNISYFAAWVSKTNCLAQVYWQKNRLSWSYASPRWTARCSPFGHKFSQKVSPVVHVLAWENSRYWFLHEMKSEERV